MVEQKKKFEIEFSGKYWTCPKCKINHLILTTSSYQPRNCDECGFKVWIWGEYVTELDTGYKYLRITRYEKYIPGKRGKKNE